MSQMGVEDRGYSPGQVRWVAEDGSAHSERGESMGVDIVIEPNARRRRARHPLAGSKRAAALFRSWHGLRDLIQEAERLGEGELVHLLAVAQMLIEEKANALTAAADLDEVEASLPN